MIEPEQRRMLISYRGLRRTVGAIGITLPLVLVVGENQLGTAGMRESLSSYYWSEAMRDVFVGGLCAIGVFLGSYRGNGKLDNVAGTLASMFAIGVALFPCSPPTESRSLSNRIHYSCAAGLFLMLSYFCLFSFPGVDPGITPRRKKPVRNKVYRVCGAAILGSITLIAIQSLAALPFKNFTFWLESIAIWAFGWSWYIKGKGLKVLQDSPNGGPGRSVRCRRSRCR